jgi:alpha-L-rhamnosidase
MLGSGRYLSPVKWDQNYGFPKMIFQLNIQYSDGTRQNIVSDTTWRLTTNGPITANNEFDGEAYDARKEMPGWNKVNFNDAEWTKAQKVSNPSEKLSAQMIDPIRIKETLKPKSIKKIKPGVYVYDMGQNMVGWVSLKVTAPEGTKVKLRFAETIHPDGELNIANLRLAKQTDVYITKGEGWEKWQPAFTYHGFRYVEISGYPGKPDLNTIEGKVIYDDINTTGKFSCSSEIINKIYNAAYWGIRGNYRSFPTDCPQRDERQAWLGDRTSGSLGESYIFDINALYAKWMTDIADEQKENGATTIWELWNGNTAPPTMNSGNHVMLLGDFATWLYQILGGINGDTENPGFKNIILKPHPVEGLDFVNAEYLSVHGLIKSSWKKEGKSLVWDIEVPCNTTATVYVAAPSEKAVTENGKRVSSAKGVNYTHTDNGYVVYQVGSGNYHFVVK